MKPPFTLGYDMVGRIDKIGPGVDQFSVGRLVADLMVIGACSEYICVPAERLTPVPDGLDPAESVSLVLSYVTAFQMLNRVAETKPEQRILVHGAGGAVGTAMIQLGRLLELEVYGTASKPKHSVISSLGAVPIDYREEDFAERIRTLASPGVDAVFDPIGGANLKRSFSVLRTGGKLVSYGFYNSVMGMGGNVPLNLTVTETAKALGVQTSHTASHITHHASQMSNQISSFSESDTDTDTDPELTAAGRQSNRS